MLPAIARRGPDGEGLFAWSGAAFGHRRLAIIDLSEAGKQPMLSEDGQIGVVFNGCIYNFVELRKELEALGQKFRSQCDTEVLLNGYAQWGIDQLVSRLRGMFAFGIWDNRCRTLFLVRDRLGVKPLLYEEGEGGIAFASTVDALKDAGFAGDLDPTAILEFLEFGFVTDERCVYQGIRKLPPGHIFEWRQGVSKCRPYWTLPLEPLRNVSFVEAVEETERLLLEAVKIRLIADVPVGALLSSGVDSGLICWALREVHGDIRTFTVSTPGDHDDESSGAAETARGLGVPHEVVPLSNSEPAPIEELCSAYGEPFASTSALGVLRVSRAVKPHATVLLTGDGGDDVFLGYEFFFNAWKAQRLALSTPDAVKPLWRVAEPLLRLAGTGKRAANFLSYAFGGIGPYARVRLGIPFFQKRQILGPRLQGICLEHREVPASCAAGKRILDDVFLFHQRFHFLSEFMPKVDAGTMYHALEARAPFLDHKLWEFAARLPYSVRFHDGQLKAVLREIARRRLGQAVATRRKQGYTIPAERWLLDRWSDDLRCLETESVAAKAGWVRQEALGETVRQALSHRETSPQLWHLVILEYWLRRRWSARA